MVTLFHSTKKTFAKHPSSSKVTSNYPPLRNDKPRSDPNSRHHESPKMEPTTNTPVALRGKDDAHSQNFQPTREPMKSQAFPRKETQIIPPESIHVPYSNRVRQTSMQEFRVPTGEKKGLQGQLLEMQNALNTTRNTCEARRKEIERLKDEVQRLDSVVVSMVSAEKMAGNKIRDLERKVLQRDENIQNLEQKLRISQEQCSQTTKLLDDRTAELKGAQTFLTTADRYSGSDIIKMAESLNAEIFQASALMAELLVDAPLVEDSIKQGQYVQKYKDNLEYGRKVIGSRLFDHLTTKSRAIRVDPLPLQLAFQALFTSWCVYEVDHFCEGPTGKSLKEIYRRIYKSEIQAVAGRWRVLTSVQTMDSDTSKASYVSNVILALMWICGGFGSQDTSQRAKLSVQQAVLRVERMWKPLKVAIKQEITAAEIILFGICAGTDYNAATMDDMYTDASSDVIMNPNNHEQHILCPVGVGLRRDVSKRCKDGTMKINGEVILKPKIALVSVLKGEPSSDTQNEMMLSVTNGKV